MGTGACRRGSGVEGTGMVDDAEVCASRRDLDLGHGAAVYTTDVSWEIAWGRRSQNHHQKR